MTGKKPGKLITAASIVFWLLVWQAAALLIGQQLLLPSPLSVLSALWGLLGEGLFWRSVANSLVRITLGFVLGLVLGCVLAVLAANSRAAEVLLRPLMLLARATPVSSFIILALVWFSSKNISVFVSFWMVLPVLYAGVLNGLRAADGQLVEMAELFRVTWWRRFRAVYLPALRPSLLAACELAYGMCWKSGIAAEVIGLPAGTVGERMYQAKIYLQMPQLFAWTAVVIFLSWAVGLAINAFVRRGSLRLEGGTFRPARGEQAVPAPARVVCTALAKRYGDQQVLRDFDTEIAPGERVAIRGGSGIGKTTLARLVLGLEAPTSGAVATQGGAGTAVFQEDRLCGQLSAAGNVALVLRRPDEKAVAALLRELGLAGADLVKRTDELSGGQRRRVALARALAAPGGLVVLDEAFKGLDDATRETAYRAVLQHLAGRTLLVVTHDQQEAQALTQRSIELESVG